MGSRIPRGGGVSPWATGSRTALRRILGQVDPFRTVLMISHDAQALSMTDRWVQLSGGRARELSSGGHNTGAQASGVLEQLGRSELIMTDPFMAYVGLVLTWVECLAFLAVCWVGSRPGATRNSWSGIRIEATMASDGAWTAGHRAALPKATMACLALLPPSLIVVFFVDRAVLLITVLEWVFMAAGLVWILVATGRPPERRGASAMPDRPAGRSKRSLPRVVRAILVPGLALSVLSGPAWLGAATPAVASTRTASLVWTPCGDDGGECADLRAPVGADPADSSLTLGIKRYRATGTAGERGGVVLFNPGGPGLSATGRRRGSQPARAGYCASGSTSSLSTPGVPVGPDRRRAPPARPRPCHSRCSPRIPASWPNSSASSTRGCSDPAPLAAGCLPTSAPSKTPGTWRLCGRRWARSRSPTSVPPTVRCWAWSTRTSTRDGCGR